MVHEIARPGAPPVDHRRDAAVERRPPQCRGIALLPEPDAEFGIGIGREYQPAFLFAARVAGTLRRFVAGVDLDRQPLGREEEFDQQRRRVAGRVLEPDFADPTPAEHTSELQSLMRISYAVFSLKQ